MIIDSHAYCWTPFDAPTPGFSGDEKMLLLQRAYAGHHQPALRINDGAVGDSAVLLDSTGGQELTAKALRHNFRLDKRRGRVVWDQENGSSSYTKYFLPPNTRDLEYTPFQLDSEMHYAGVDAVLLHTDPSLVRSSVPLGEICNSADFRGRFFAMAPVDEWRIVSELEDVLAGLRRAVHEDRLHCIKFIPPLCYRAGDTTPWDDGPYRPFWEAVTELGVPVFFTMGNGPVDFAPSATVAEQRRGYLDEQAILIRWMQRYPDIVCSLTHGFNWRLWLEPAPPGSGALPTIALPDEIWRPWREVPNPLNCNLEVCVPVRVGDIFDYPYAECRPALREMIAHVGAERLLWGTVSSFRHRPLVLAGSRQDPPEAFLCLPSLPPEL